MTIFALFCFGLFALAFLAGLALVIAQIAAWSRHTAHNPDAGRWLAFGVGMGCVVLAALLFVGFVSTRSVAVSEMSATPVVHHLDSFPLPHPPTIVIDHPQMSPASLMPVRIVIAVVVVNVLFGLGVFWLLSTRSRRTTDPGMSSTRSRRFLSAPAGVVLAVISLGLFLSAGLVHTRREHHATLLEEVHQQAVARDQVAAAHAQLERLPPEEVKVPTTLVRLTDEPADAGAVLNRIPDDDLPQADRTNVDSNTPDWLATGRHDFNGQELTVIASQQYATVQEARVDADAQVAELLMKDMARFTRASLRPRLSPVTGSDVHRAVRDEYVQSVDRDFGSFFAPMYRVWYKVELSPAVREPYLVNWRAQLIEYRTIAVGTGCLAMLLAPLGIVFAGTIGRATGCRGRSIVNAATAFAVVAAWGAGAWWLNQLVVLWG